MKSGLVIKQTKNNNEKTLNTTDTYSDIYFANGK